MPNSPVVNHCPFSGDHWIVFMFQKNRGLLATNQGLVGSILLGAQEESSTYALWGWRCAYHGRIAM